MRGGGTYLASATRRALGAQNPKVFCIGRNKTGTTSLKHVLEDLGYRVGNQRRAELLMEDWGQRDFRRLIRYCHSADAFQDVPFSYAYTFQAMDAAFPGSKFILTVRDSDEQWYQSLVRFHAKRLERRTGERRTPTLEDIKSDKYVHPGWIWRVRELVGVAASSIEAYPEQPLKDYYNWYNATVQDYFRNRPQDLLVVNLAEADSMERLCRFLDKPYDGTAMPRLNQSK
ncbi:hypothetical protein BA898_05125 [Spiribacter roseus]|nr:hypothetical protein BA898_05125 [Spiribacter roseus]